MLNAFMIIDDASGDVEYFATEMDALDFLRDSGIDSPIIAVVVSIAEFKANLAKWA